MTEAQKKIRKRIKDRERRFQKMTPAQKRVAIARDVIEALDAEKIVAYTGCYINGPFFDELFKPDIDEDYDLRDRVIEMDMPTCTACAIGSMFLCSLMRKDALSAAEVKKRDWKDNWYIKDTDMRDYMSDYFSHEQMGLIETAFEGDTNFALRAQCDVDETKAAAYMFWSSDRYGYYYNSGPDTRLRAIMQNIIKNKGTFIPVAHSHPPTP